MGVKRLSDKTCAILLALIFKSVWFLLQVLLSDYLIPAYKENEEDSESGVFYHKMKGDYLRYLAEVAEGDEKSGEQIM